MTTFTAACSLMALFCSTPVLHAEYLTGQVKAGVTGDPIPDAVVTLIAPGQDHPAGQAQTLVNGAYILSIAGPGAYRMIVDRDGYFVTRFPLNLPGKGIPELSIPMRVRPVLNLKLTAASGEPVTDSFEICTSVMTERGVWGRSIDRVWPVDGTGTVREHEWMLRRPAGSRFVFSIRDETIGCGQVTMADWPRSPAPVELRLAPGRTITGTVKDRHGAGMTGVEVVFSMPGGASQAPLLPSPVAVVTGWQGRFSIPALFDGTYTLRTIGPEAGPASIVVRADMTPLSLHIGTPDLLVEDASAPGRALARSDKQIPSAPIGLAALVGDGEVRLSWVAAGGASSYRVLRAVGPGSEFRALASGVRATSFSDRTAVNDTTYRYQVEAINALGASGTSDSAVATPTADQVWVGDDLPPNARTMGDGADNWNWLTGDPSPQFGQFAHASGDAVRLYQHYYTSDTDTYPVKAGDTLIAWTYLDPDDPPTTIMLQWNDGTWEHRAYWGADKIPYGAGGIENHLYMGPLPALGKWVRLEVPAERVALEGSRVNSVAFTVYDGRVTWAHVGLAGRRITVRGQAGNGW